MSTWKHADFQFHKNSLSFSSKYENSWLVFRRAEKQRRAPTSRTSLSRGGRDVSSVVSAASSNLKCAVIDFRDVHTEQSLSFMMAGCSRTELLLRHGGRCHPHKLGLDVKTPQTRFLVAFPTRRKPGKPPKLSKTFLSERRAGAHGHERPARPALLLQGTQALHYCPPLGVGGITARFHLKSLFTLLKIKASQTAPKPLSVLYNTFTISLLLLTLFEFV